LPYAAFAANCFGEHPTDLVNDVLNAVYPEENATLYNVACSYALMGETDQALTLLEGAVCLAS
jgi:hypothetical protein